MFYFCSLTDREQVMWQDTWKGCQVSAPSIEWSKGFAEMPSTARMAPFDERGNSAGSTLSALAETPLASRFCSWRGLSGRRYVFSVYAPSKCPAFCNAVLLAAVIDHTGRRRMVSVRETGAFPEPVIKRAELELSGYCGRLEFHVHLLASTPAKRDAVLADLAVASR
jgi:hypothetical protein